MPNPARVLFYSNMAIEAMRRNSGAGGGFRVYVLAKAIDAQGLGAVSRNEVRGALVSLGVSRMQIARWFTEARWLGLTDIQRESGEWVFILPSPAKVIHKLNKDANGLGCRVSMPVSMLFGTGWKARTWAAVEGTIQNGLPRSREFFQKHFNVPARTQCMRDTQAGVIRNFQVARTEHRADALPMLQENTNYKMLHVGRDNYIYYRKPDVRIFPEAQREPKGRTRKDNKVLKQMQNIALSQKRRGLGYTAIRQYNVTERQFNTSAKRLAQSDLRKDLFLLKATTRRSVGIWTKK